MFKFIKFSLLDQTHTWLIIVYIFLSMLVAIWIGNRVGKWRKKSIEKSGLKISTAGVGYLIGLLTFMLGFSFSMSSSRFEKRRDAIVSEANHIGIAYMRSDLYPLEESKLFKKDFKAYLESRIAFFESGADFDEVASADHLSHVIASKLFTRAARISLEPGHAEATRLMIPAINEMIDAGVNRKAAEAAKIPEGILWLLFFLAFSSAFFLSYMDTINANIDYLIKFGFCLLFSVAIGFILDLDRPRRGKIDLDLQNQFIVELREELK